MTSNFSIRILKFAFGLAIGGTASAKALPAECGALASQEAYSAPESLSWTNALTFAFAALPNENSELAFFNPPKYSGITGRPLIDLKREGALPKQDDLNQNSERALRIPVKGDQFGGGPVAFGADVFANENFKWRFSVEVPEDRSATSLQAWWFPITLRQPWLEWRSEENKFVWHAEDAQTRLLCRLLQRGPTVRLFRGTILQEATLLDALKSALLPLAENNVRAVQSKLLELMESSRLIAEYYRTRDGAASFKALKAQRTLDSITSWSKEFDSGRLSSAQLAEQLKVLLEAKMRGTDYGAFFTSSERERAKGFVKGALLTFEFPVAVLLELNRRHLLYVGIENDIEIAFLPGLELPIFVDGFRSFERMEGKR